MKKTVLLLSVVLIFGCARKTNNPLNSGSITIDFDNSKVETTEFTVAAADSLETHMRMWRDYRDTSNHVEIIYKGDVVASYENGKWGITDCQKSIEALMKCIKVQQDQYQELLKSPREPIKYSSLKTNQ